MSSKISKYVVLFRLLLLTFIQHRSSKNSSHEWVYLFATFWTHCIQLQRVPLGWTIHKKRPSSLILIFHKGKILWWGYSAGGLQGLLYRPIYDCLVFGFVIAIMWLRRNSGTFSTWGWVLHVKHINSQIKRAEGNELLLWFQCQ